LPIQISFPALCQASGIVGEETSQFAIHNSEFAKKILEIPICEINIYV